MENNYPLSNKAFVGMSLDGKLFNRKWLRFALNKLVDRHSEILFLLADDLLRYTRTAKKDNGYFALDIDHISNLITQRSSEFKTFINSEIGHLDKIKSNKIIIRTWDDFSDNKFVYILRNIIIAHDSIKPFRSLVNDVAISHYKKIKKINVKTFFNSIVAYILDEISMCIRVAEVGNYYNEYYPSDQNEIISSLYNDDFSQYGLTIESISGIITKKRRFTSLICPETTTNN